MKALASWAATSSNEGLASGVNRWLYARSASPISFKHNSRATSSAGVFKKLARERSYWSQGRTCTGRSCPCAPENGLISLKPLFGVKLPGLPSAGDDPMSAASWAAW